MENLNDNTLGDLHANNIDLLIRYFKGAANADEINTIRQWLDASAENKRLFDELNDIWLATAKKESGNFVDTFQALQKVRERIGDTKETKDSDKVVRLNSVYQQLLKIAAIFILAFMLGAGTIYFYADHKIAKTENELTEITAPIGSKTHIRLPDGTMVWLNAGSKLTYNTNFNSVNREVSLEGEAYFDVTKRNHQLFLVKTKEVTVRVLGTAFNVKAYPKEGSVETTLVRGSLIVEQHENDNSVKETILKPNQRATLIKDHGDLYLSEVERVMIKKEEGEKMVKIEEIKGKLLFSNKVKTEDFTAWKDNKLVFKNEKFESLAIKLERWYGAKIIIKDPEINNYHFSGSICNETVEDVMKLIKYTLNIDYAIQHNTITIQKGEN